MTDLSKPVMELAGSTAGPWYECSECKVEVVDYSDDDLRWYNACPKCGHVWGPEHDD